MRLVHSFRRFSTAKPFFFRKTISFCVSRLCFEKCARDNHMTCETDSVFRFCCFITSLWVCTTWRCGSDEDLNSLSPEILLHNDETQTRKTWSFKFSKFSLYCFSAYYFAILIYYLRTYVSITSLTTNITISLTIYSEILYKNFTKEMSEMEFSVFTFMTNFRSLNCVIASSLASSTSTWER